MIPATLEPFKYPDLVTHTQLKDLTGFRIRTAAKAFLIFELARLILFQALMYGSLSGSWKYMRLYKQRPSVLTFAGLSAWRCYHCAIRAANITISIRILFI